MPVHTSDLKVSGNEIHKLIEKETRLLDCERNGQKESEKNYHPSMMISAGDAMKYLLVRVQSGNISNDREALLQAMERKLEKIKKAEKG